MSKRMCVLPISAKLMTDLFKSGQKHFIVGGNPLPEDTKVVYAQFNTQMSETNPTEYIPGTSEVWLYLESEWFPEIDDEVEVPFLQKLPEIQLFTKWEDYFE